MKTNPDRSIKTSLRRQAALFGLICAAVFALAPVARAATLTFSPATSGGSTFANYTWVCPPNVTSVQVECWGGGGGGGGCKVGFTGAGGGGGGGSYVSYNLTVTPGTLYNLTVGTAGAAGSNAGGGGNGGNASFFGNTTAGNAAGATVSAPGGKGGTGNTLGTYSAGGAVVSTGALPASGATVNYALAGGNSSSTGPTSGGGSAGAGAGGSSGGGAGGAAITPTAGAGIAGTGPGGGGSGALSAGTALAGGAGAAGQIKLTFPVNANATVNTYQASTTWTCPSGVNFITVECWGGGGGGGGNTAPGGAGTGGGGGAGGSYIQYNTAVVPGHVYGITVGAGGTVVSQGAGNSGGVSTFADNNTSTTIASASGGGGGGAGTAGSPGTAGTISSSFTPSSGATYAYSGSPGTNGTITTTTGGGGGPGAGATGSAGGGIGTAINPTTATAGYAGNAPGGGGSGSSTGGGTPRAGGVGGTGQVQISYLNTPAVTSSAATSIGTTNATLNGNLTQIGTGAFTSGGFVYNTSSPATAGTYATVAGLGSATGAYTLTPTNLSVNTHYFFDAEAINTYGTVVSTPELNFWTLANTPNAPTVANPTSASLDVTINNSPTSDGNPSGTTYAIYETSTGKYVTSGGKLTNSTPVYQTASAWGTKTVTGLLSGTAYTFEVQALNGASVATSLGSGTTVSTTAGATKMLTVLPGQTYSSGSAPSGTPTAQNAGTAFTVDLYAVATDGVTVDTTYTGNKTITITGPTANTFSPSTPGVVTFASGHGQITTLTLNQAASTQIISGDGLLTALASTAVAVNAGSAVNLQALMPGETAAAGTGTGKTGTPTTQVAGTAFNVTVNAVDAYWNVVSSSDVVDISASTDSAATVPTATVALSGGTATIPFTFKTATVSGWTVTAHDTSIGALTDSTSASTLVNPGVSTKLVFTTSPVTVQAGVASGTITVQRQDANSNPNTANSTISLALSSTSTGTVTFSPASPLSITTGSSSASFTYMDTQNGTPTITAASSGLTSGTQIETVTNGAPLAPTNLTVIADYPDVALRWTSSLGVPASYNVYRSTTSGSGYAAISTAGAVTGTNYTDSTAVPGTTYYYVVTGTNSSGESSYSPQVSATLVVPTLDLRMPLNGAYTGANTTAPSDTSSGGVNVTATMYASNAVPTDYHGVSGSGINGASGSYAMDFSSVPYAAGTLPASGPLTGVTNANSALGFGTVSNWTATFWFKQSALWLGGSLGPRFFSLGTIPGGDGGANNLSMKFNAQSGTTATMQFTFGSGVTATYNYTQVSNQWVYCAAVYDGNNMSIYIGSPTNPAVNVTNVAVVPANGVINFGASSYLFLGNRADLARPMAGFLSDFRFYNGAGDINYVESIRNNGFPTAAPAGLAGTPGNNQVALTWSAVPYAVSYNVKRSTASGGEVTITNVTTTSLADLGLVNYTPYYYVVSAVNASAFESTNSTEIVVAPVPPATPPTATVSPATLTTNCGVTINLTAVTAGTPPLTYQWYDKNTNPISSGTNQVLTLASINPTNSGNYTVVVTNLFGSVTNFGTLTVVDAVPPVVTLNGGSSTNVLLGSVFTDPGATAVDACEGALTVTTNGSVNTAVAGAYTINYSANDGYNSTTNTRTVTVVTNYLVQLDFAPVTSTVPTPAGFTKITIPYNNTAVTNYAFTNVAGSGYTLTFTNIKSYVPNTPPYPTIDQDGFTAPNGSGVSTFTLTKLPTNVQVTAYACWGWDANTHKPIFVYAGATNVVTVGTDITSPGTNTFSNVGSMVATGTSNGTINGQFYGNLVGGSTEGQVGGMIFVVQTAVAPTATISPSTATVECSSGTATLTATVIGAGPLTYQWYDNTHTAITGQTNLTLALANLHAAQSGNYYFTAANPAGSVTATNTVTVVDTVPPALTANSNITVTVPYGTTGSNVTFSVMSTADTCDGTTTTGSTPASGSFFPLGNTTVTTYAYDTSGNTNYSSFHVIVQSFNTNALLTSLSFSPSGGFTPTFMSNVLTGYSETNSSSDAVTVTAVNADATAANTLIVNGVSQGSLPNSTPSGTLSLGIGSNDVQVQVVSQDLAVTNTYDVTVTVASSLSSNAVLASLSITPAGALNPTFDSGTLGYNATNAYADNPVTVLATSVDANATLQLSFNGGGYGSPVTSSLSIGGNTLVLPTNTVAVQVVSQDLTTTNVYTVNVVLQPNTSSPPVLANSVSGGALSLDWGADHLGYRLLVQTNNLANGVSGDINDWMTVPGSESITSTNITIITAGVTNEYYQIVYP